MAERRPIVLINGNLQELPSGDTLPTGPVVEPGLSAQYWRINQPDSDFSGDLQMAELTFWDTGGVQIVPASGTSTAVYAGTVANLWDGDVNTFWWSSDAFDNGTGWISFDFGTSITPAEIRVTAPATGSRAMTTWTLQYSNDNSTWIDVTTVSGETVFSSFEMRAYDMTPFTGPGTGGNGELQHNYSATTPPAITDDNNSGYAVGSRWIDTANQREYVCLDASTNAAVWTETTQSASGATTQQNEVVASTYSTVSGDFIGNVIKKINNATGCTVTVEPSMTNNEPVTFIQTGSGQVTFTTGTGVTVNSYTGMLSTAGQYSSVTLIPDKTTANLYYLIGHLS